MKADEDLKVSADQIAQVVKEAIRDAANAALEIAAKIALAIDSGRGNEKEIAAAIRRLKVPQ